MEVVIGILGKAHGIRGDVLINIRTDNPALRLAPGSLLHTDNPDFGQLEVQNLRQVSSRDVISFSQITNRDEAEKLRGTKLLLEVKSQESIDDEEGYYPDQLIGLEVYNLENQYLGRVIDLEPSVAQDLLVVCTNENDEVRVPFVHALVPVVDLTAQKIVVNPPGGLFPGFGQEA